MGKGICYCVMAFFGSLQLVSALVFAFAEQAVSKPGCMLFCVLCGQLCLRAAREAAEK